MEKVELTQEQADAIKNLLTTWDEEYFLKTHAENLKGRGYLSSVLHCLNSLTLSELSKALFIGYQIEESPNFNPGDKVVRVDGMCFRNFKEIGTVSHIETPTIVALFPPDDGEGFDRWTKDMIRHANQEEIFWLETLSRNGIGDFREGDVFIDDSEESYQIYNNTNRSMFINTDDAKTWYDKGDFYGIYPAESFKRYPQEESK